MDQLRIYAILAIRAVRPAVHPAVNNFVIARSMPCAPPRSVPPAKLPLMWQLAVARYVSYRSTRLYTDQACTCSWDGQRGLAAARRIVKLFTAESAFTSHRLCVHDSPMNTPLIERD